MNRVIMEAYIRMYAAFRTKDRVLIAKTLDDVVLVTSYMLPFSTEDETRRVQNFILDAIDIRNEMFRNQIRIEDGVVLIRAKVDSMLLSFESTRSHCANPNMMYRALKPIGSA